MRSSTKSRGVVQACGRAHEKAGHSREDARVRSDGRNGVRARFVPEHDRIRGVVRGGTEREQGQRQHAQARARAASRARRLSLGGRRDDFDRLVAGMSNRFRGSGWSGQYAEKLARRATPETELALLRAQLDANPDDWRADPRLARALIKQGKAAEARRLYLGYPPFRG